MTLLPGATYDPGAHWNYEAGVSSCLMEVWHYTVGNDSRALIRDQGLAAALVWDNVIWEYAPLDAVCFTECEWNRRSIGVEVESLDGSITPGQIANLGYITLFCLTTFGIPQVFYDGPRMPVGTDYRGVTNHRNLVHNACDQHSDGFDRWVWDAIMSPPPKQPGDTMASFLIAETRAGHPDVGKVWLVDADANTKAWVHNPAALAAAQQVRAIVKFTGGWADGDLHATTEADRPWAGLVDDARDLDAQDDVAAGGGSGTGGATPAQVTAIVTASEARLREDVNRPRQTSGTVS